MAGRPRYQLELAFRVGRVRELRHHGMRWLASSTHYGPVQRALSEWVGPKHLNARFLPVDVELEAPSSIVLPKAVLERFLKAASCRVAMHRCLCRDAFECGDYPRELGCLFLGSAAERIHPSMGRKVSVEEGMELVDRALSRGLVALAGKVSADALVLGVGDHRNLMTICFCCECCCTARFARFLSEPSRAGLCRLEGIDVSVSEACAGCGTCVDACIASAISLEDGRAAIDENCLGCGRCARDCPQGAVTLRADGNLLQRAIETLEAAVDVRG